MLKDVTYAEMLLTERWRQKRKEILDRDGRKCRNCGENTNLQVHHRQYHIHGVTGLKREPWDYSNYYLVLLCRKCHEAGHKQYKIPVYNK